MATNKMKFEVSLKELTFKFEGDFEQGQRIQTGISKALGDIAKLQDTAVGIQEPKQIQGPVINVPRRKARKRRADENGEGGTKGGENGVESEERRSTGTSGTTLLQTIRTEGFFNNPQTTKQIVSHLVTNGHTSVRTTDLTKPLLKMVQQKELKRGKNGEGVWEYSNFS
jgi:hypothetical protein